MKPVRGGGFLKIDTVQVILTNSFWAAMIIHPQQHPGTRTVIDGGTFKRE
jgi:hypothetical protein